MNLPPADDRPALIDMEVGVSLSRRRLASEITGVATGLRARGTRPGHVVAVLTDTISAHALAVQTILAAGAVAAPLTVPDTAEDLARRLTDLDARMIVTTPKLAGLAVEAAEFSRVRQVVCFGEAEGTVDFASLHSRGPIMLPGPSPLRDALVLPDGRRLNHADLFSMMNRMDEPLRLLPSDVVLVGWCPDASPHLSALIALVLARGALLVAGGLHDARLVTVVAEPGRPPQRI
ncbi:AMP-binding protein [Actinocorallia longicatena]|uniref:AMP-dependent synthetase/ligase domain-containing protein n=1 Tax=Actinocorallia longicatena TaxID=111803 RepID=A0ABP6Q601_9ACTN